MSGVAARQGDRSTVFQSISGVARGALRQPDYWLLTIILLLVMFGAVMVFSSSFAIGVRQEDGDGYYFLTRHLMYLIVGLAGMLVAMSIDYHFWRKLALPGLLVVMAVLALMVLVPGIAPVIDGASRWIQLGPVSVQPSEFAKLALVLYLASWLSSKGTRVREFNYGLIPFSILMGFLIGLIMLQPDLGTSILLTAVGLSMFLVAGANLLHLSLISVVGSAAFLLLALSAPYRRERILVFLNPNTDVRDLGWQLANAKLAIGSGGLLGVGLGSSHQKFAWLPAAHNDAIFAVIAEELGLMGAGFLLFLFVALAWRGYRVAMRAPDSFGALIAVGIVTWMTFQAAINIGGVTLTIPFTGIPIPFISYGGSSLVVSLTAMGILLNVSRQTLDPVSVKVRSSMTSSSTSGPSHIDRPEPEPVKPKHVKPNSRKTPARTERRPVSDTAFPHEPVSGVASERPRSRSRTASIDGRRRASTGQFGRGADTVSNRNRR